MPPQLHRPEARHPVARAHSPATPALGPVDFRRQHLHRAEALTPQRPPVRSRPGRLPTPPQRAVVRPWRAPEQQTTTKQPPERCTTPLADARSRPGRLSTPPPTLGLNPGTGRRPRVRAEAGQTPPRRSKVRGLSAPEVDQADFPRHDPPPPPTPTRHPRPRQMPLGLNPPRARAKSRRVRFPTPPTGPPQTRTRPERHQKSTGPTSCSTNTGHAATATQTGSTAFGGRGTLAGHTGTRPGRLPTPAPGRGGDVPMATRQKSARSTFHTANRPRPRPGEGANAKAEAEGKGKGKAEGEDRSGARCADRQHQKSAGPTSHATTHPGRSPGTGASTDTGASMKAKAGRKHGAGQATARRSGVCGLPTPEVGGADFLLRRNGPSSDHGKHRSSRPRRSGRQSGAPRPLPTPEVGRADFPRHHPPRPRPRDRGEHRGRASNSQAQQDARTTDTRSRRGRLPTPPPPLRGRSGCSSP